MDSPPVTTSRPMRPLSSPESLRAGAAAAGAGDPPRLCSAAAMSPCATPPAHAAAVAALACHCPAPVPVPAPAPGAAGGNAGAKKKRKKKAKSSYSAIMSAMLEGNQEDTAAQRQRQRERIRQSLGGGAFSKLDRI